MAPTGCFAHEGWEAGAASAVATLDGTTMMGRKLSVQPSRRADAREAKKARAAKDSSKPSAAAAAVSMVPRALRRSAQQSLSNADFRALYSSPKK